MLADKVVSALRPFWFRGKGRIFRTVLPDSGEVEAKVFGCQMRLDLSDRIQKGIYLGVFEPFETRFVRRYLKPGMVFADVGANVGYFTALSASLVGTEGRVLAIEPSPVAFRSLEKLVERNQLNQVSLGRFGLSSAGGEVDLYGPAEGNHNHAPTLVASAGGMQWKVQVKTLDECMDEWGVDRIDLMKIDIEGHELEAFRGAERALREGRISAILCEFNDYWLRAAGTSPEEMMAFLEGHGFKPEGHFAELKPGGVRTYPFILRRAKHLT